MVGAGGRIEVHKGPQAPPSNLSMYREGGVLGEKEKKFTALSLE